MPSKKPDPTNAELLADPFILCGVAALFDALRYLNERDPCCRVLPNMIALEAFVIRRRDGLLGYHFRDWKSRRMLLREKRLANTHAA